MFGLAANVCLKAVAGRARLVGVATGCSMAWMLGFWDVTRNSSYSCTGFFPVPSLPQVPVILQDLRAKQRVSQASLG